MVPQPGLPTPAFFPNNGSHRSNPARRHPPAVIAQPQGDDFVPPTVANNYIAALRKAGIDGKCALTSATTATGAAAAAAATLQLPAQLPSTLLD